MKWIEGGEFWRGRDASDRPDEVPRHRVRVAGFFLDETLVTHADFERFVEESRYLPSAEKLGFGMVAREGMNDWEWDEVKGASWRQPFGPGHPELTPRADDPAVMVSWYDADAFCRARGKRLPTEAEWEYAARAGSTGRFPWGDSPRLPDGGMGLNYWQGANHQKNAMADGYRYVSPVRAFPPNAWGIYDAVGNAWQWTADWYAEDAYATAAKAAVTVNPTGPPSGKLKVARGGSWWCSSHTCSGYGLFFRGKSRPDAPYNNNGFRCAAEAASHR
jgi:sulfatase modifying factor 1